MKNNRYFVINVYIIETSSVFVFKNYITKEVSSFILSNKQYDLEILIDFLQKGDSHFGFNNLNYDSQLIEFVFSNKEKFIKLSKEEVIGLLHDYSSKLKLKNTNHDTFLDYEESKLSFNIFDLFTMNHWNFGSKKASFNWIKNNINADNINSLHPEVKDTNIIENYCKYNISIIEQLVKLSKIQLKLRNSLNKKFDFKCTNYSNTKLGSDLLLKLYSDKTNKNPKIVSNQRSPRNSILVKDILFDYLSFKTPEFKAIYDKFYNLEIFNTKKEFHETVKYKNHEFTFGLGGIHSVKKNSIHKTNKEYLVIEADVTSQHPYIAIENKLFPEHLGIEFCDLLKKEILDVRAKEKTKEIKDIGIIEGFKDISISIYGNSNLKYSWLYDPKFTMTITINSQLMLSMLIERLLLMLNDPIIIQANTDGITVKIKRTDYDKYKFICSEWSKLTKLNLEFRKYRKLFIWDINNYIADINEHENKSIGRFHWQDFTEMKYSVLHKNKSFIVIAKGVFNYFVNNIKPEKYIKTNTNIFDYCTSIKLDNEWHCIEHYWNDGNYGFNIYNNIVRYYISVRGNDIVKENAQAIKQKIRNDGYLITVLNNHKQKKWEDYDINYNFYIDKIWENIKKIEPFGPDIGKQMSLF